MTFLERWTWAVEVLKEKLGGKIIPKNKIEFGKYGVKPSGAPFVLVYMEPEGGQKLENGAYPIESAIITVACGVAGSTEQQKSTSEAVNMAFSVVRAFKGLPAHAIGKPEIDGIFDGTIVAIAQFRTFFSIANLEGE